MTISGIEPATFRFVAQHLNHCATAEMSLRENIIMHTQHYSTKIITYSV